MITVSFNSYKGGSCRTTTCYNTLPFIAKQLKATAHNPILVFDFDLDSMGLTNIFDQKMSLQDKKLRQSYSARNLFCDSDAQRVQEIRNLDDCEDSYFEKYNRVGNQLGLEDDKSVLFCGVDENAPTITDDQYEQIQSNSPLQNLLQVIFGFSEEDKPRAIVFDCASGIQMTTLMVLAFTDKIVMCLRPTVQARIGTLSYMKNRLPEQFSKARRGSQKREVILLPTSVAGINIGPDDENREEAIAKLKKLRRKALSDINSSLIGGLRGYDREYGLFYSLNTEMVDPDENDLVGIPEIERFKWEEGLLFTMESITEQEKQLYGRYEKLSSIITRE